MQRSDQPFVSIVTVNYNQTDTTCEFLNSLKSLSYKKYEVIVVDNNSIHNPTNSLKKAYSSVKVILSKTNLGFAGGNNLGIRKAKGDYIFIVNNDTVVTHNLIEKLLMPFYLFPTIGIVSPKIRYYDKPNIIQYAGFTTVNPLTGRNKSIGSSEIDKGQYNKAGFTSYAHGAAMMVKREVIEKVGLLPDIFFLYYEELDWSSQITRAGYKIYYEPRALIYHKESVTIGKESIIKKYYYTRNRILFMRRNVTPFQLAIFLPYFIIAVIPKTIFECLITFQVTHLKAFFKAIKWNLSHICIRSKKPANAIPPALV